ncbi:MAG: PilX N-terminal domain-containing pilus assembly protein [Oleiphilus sp.]
MKYQNSCIGKHQQGAVLATSLLLLLVLTLVAVTAMDTSNLSYRMASNNIYHDQSFNNSESARISSTSVLQEYLYEGEWTNVLLPIGLSVATGGGELIQANGDTEDRYLNSSLQKDLEFSSGGITADIYVLRGPTALNSAGAGSAQWKGYGGTGVAAGAAGGAYKFYEFRSVGTNQSGAQSWTASDYKYVQ